MSAPRIERPRFGTTDRHRQHPRHGKEIGPTLHLVDDHETLERAQCRHRLVEPRQADRILEVEAVDRILVEQLPGERRLAAPARSDEHVGIRSAGIAARLGIVPGGGDAGQRLTLVLDGGVQRRRLEPHAALPLTIVF